MARAGRNQRCGCGSGRKIKHCCGQRRGPSDVQLARATLAVEGRGAARRLAHHDDEDFAEIFEAMLDLPELDHTMLVDLPRLHTLELERLRLAIEDDDSDAVEGALPAVVARCDNPLTRLALLRAVQRLCQSGWIAPDVADAATFDLSQPHSDLVEVSVLRAVAVDAGAALTASGLLVAAR